MLTGINPLLTGDILKALDEMGHSDYLVIADANFPAHRLCGATVEVTGVDATTMTAAVREVLPLDADNPPVLMDSGGEELPTVQLELLSAAGSPQRKTMVDRWKYYDLTKGASLVISTGELRLWANIILYKGILYSD